MVFHTYQGRGIRILIYHSVLQSLAYSVGIPLERDTMLPLEVFLFRACRSTIAINGILGKIILLQLIKLEVTMGELFSHKEELV